MSFDDADIHASSQTKLVMDDPYTLDKDLKNIIEELFPETIEDQLDASIDGSIVNYDTSSFLELDSHSNSQKPVVHFERQTSHADVHFK